MAMIVVVWYLKCKNGNKMKDLEEWASPKEKKYRN